jgi:hypothetical protein
VVRPKGKFHEKRSGKGSFRRRAGSIVASAFQVSSVVPQLVRELQHDLSIFVKRRPPKQCFKSHFVIFITCFVQQFENNKFGHFGTEMHPLATTAGSFQVLTAKILLLPVHFFFTVTTCQMCRWPNRVRTSDNFFPLFIRPSVV